MLYPPDDLTLSGARRARLEGRQPALVMKCRWPNGSSVDLEAGGDRRPIERRRPQRFEGRPPCVQIRARSRRLKLQAGPRARIPVAVLLDFYLGSVGSALSGSIVDPGTTFGRMVSMPQIADKMFSAVVVHVLQKFVTDKLRSLIMGRVPRKEECPWPNRIPLMPMWAHACASGGLCSA
jgi:hypothetical protein